MQYQNGSVSTLQRHTFFRYRTMREGACMIETRETRIVAVGRVKWVHQGEEYRKRYEHYSHVRTTLEYDAVIRVCVV